MLFIHFVSPSFIRSTFGADFFPNVHKLTTEAADKRKLFVEKIIGAEEEVRHLSLFSFE